MKFKTAEIAEQINQIAFSPDERFVAAGGDAECYIVDTQSGKCVETLSGAMRPMPQFHARYGLWTAECFVTFASSKLKLPEFSKYEEWTISRDATLLTVYTDGDVLVTHDLKSGRILEKDKLKKHCPLMLYSPRGSFYYALDNRLYCKPKVGAKPLEVLALKEELRTVAVSADESRLVVSGFEGDLQVFDTKSRSFIGAFSRPSVEYVQDALITPDQRYCLARCCVFNGDDTLHPVRILDLKDCRDVGTLTNTSGGNIECIGLSKSGNYFAANGENYELQVWQFSELLKHIVTSRDPQLESASAAKTLRDELLAVRAHDCTLAQIYELSDGNFPAQAEFGGDDDQQRRNQTNKKTTKEPFPLYLRKGRKLYDMMNMNPGLMVNQRVIAVLKAKVFKGWESYPLDVHYYKDQKPESAYAGLKISATCGPILEQARESSNDYRCFVDLRKWDGSDLFRPQGSMRCMVTHGVIQALVEAGISGWKATRVSDRTEIEAPPPSKKRALSTANKTPPAKPRIVGNRISAEKLNAIIGKHGLAKIRKKILAAARPACELQSCTPQKGTEAIGATRLGGVPDLPAGVAWPESEGTPLGFLGQLRLSDFAKLEKSEGLPSEGMLSFFCQYEQRMGWFPTDRKWQVYYSMDCTTLAPAVPPENLPAHAVMDARGVTIHPILSIPHYEDQLAESWHRSEEDRESYMNLHENLLQTSSGCRHQYLGYSQFLQGDIAPLVRDEAKEVGISPKEPWRTLLVLDSDSDLGLQFGDCGRLYVMIAACDLKKSRFDRCWMTAQW